MISMTVCIYLPLVRAWWDPCTNGRHSRSCEQLAFCQLAQILEEAWSTQTTLTRTTQPSPIPTIQTTQNRTILIQLLQRQSIRILTMKTTLDLTRTPHETPRTTMTPQIPH